MKIETVLKALESIVCVEGDIAANDPNSYYSLEEIKELAQAIKDLQLLKDHANWPIDTNNKRLCTADEIRNSIPTINTSLCVPLQYIVEEFRVALYAVSRCDSMEPWCHAEVLDTYFRMCKRANISDKISVQALSPSITDEEYYSDYEN